jgi:2-polyprenyl-6-hydroxyphenyl methylase/3-demethylubiquinone-9 3-methyltransferase
MNDKITFSFGKNWDRFLDSLNPTRLKIAESSIVDFLEVDSFSNKSVLDIGCGSGIFSYSFYQLGAKKLVSFDVDPYSVACCKHMRERAGGPDNWEVLEASVLDKKKIGALGKFDIVYSWGVLHHTGDMWKAIGNATTLVHKNGYLYITIYNKTSTSIFWLWIKKIYNKFPLIGKFVIVPLEAIRHFLLYVAGGKNPVTEIRNYYKKRGMRWHNDLVDWLGGYPYEYASIQDIFIYFKNNHPDFKLINLKDVNGIGCNSFLFIKE